MHFCKSTSLSPIGLLRRISSLTMFRSPLFFSSRVETQTCIRSSSDVPSLHLSLAPSCSVIVVGQHISCFETRAPKYLSETKHDEFSSVCFSDVDRRSNKRSFPTRTKHSVTYGHFSSFLFFACLISSPHANDLERLEQTEER